jgi:hypothetical protein
MTGEKGSLTRRNFMAVGSAIVAAPLLTNVAGMIPEANAEEKKAKVEDKKAKVAEKKYQFVEQKSCDLVVLGGGGSGLVAAVRAAQLTGKKVIVLEKDTTAGGGAQGARSFRCFGSKWQAKRNIPDTTSEYAHEKMEWMYWWLDQRVVNNGLRGTGQFFDWMGEQGADLETGFTAEKYVFAHGKYEPVGPQKVGFGRFVMTTMKDRCKALGVEVLTKHPVVDIEVKDGKIVAAIAKSDAGYVRIACKACVLATGSWIRNDAVCKKYAPEFYEAMFGAGAQSGGQGGPGAPAAGAAAGGAAQGGAPAGQAAMSGGGPGGQGGAPGGAAGGPGGAAGGPGAGAAAGAAGGAAGGPGGAPAGGAAGGPGGGAAGGPGAGGHGNVGHTSSNYTGDGIPLAEKVGAFVDYDSFVIRPMGPLPGGGASSVCNAMMQTPFVVTVNKHGKRYVCESIIMNLGFFDGGSVLTNQGGKSWDIFDDDTIAAALKYQKLPESEKKPMKEVDLVPGFKVKLPETLEDIQADLKANSATILKGDTLEELADKLGVDRKNFVETIKKYNEGCESGEDEFFKSKEFLTPLKKAPFYASKGSLGTDGAFGGVRVNHEMQAYKADRTNLIEGLYVAGDFASGRHVNVRGVKWQVLNDLSWAFSSGYLAGTNVASYLKKLG